MISFEKGLKANSGFIFIFFAFQEVVFKNKFKIFQASGVFSISFHTFYRFKNKIQKASCEA
jgi:hypothetical protein